MCTDITFKNPARSCGKTQAQFQGMEVGNSSFKAFIDLFTNNTYIMAILSDPRITTPLLKVNIQAGRQGFEAFIP